MFAGSLASDRTYQFRVFMNKYGSDSIRADGYVIVNVQGNQPNLIAVA